MCCLLHRPNKHYPSSQTATVHRWSFFESSVQNWLCNATRRKNLLSDGDMRDPHVRSTCVLYVATKYQKFMKKNRVKLHSTFVWLFLLAASSYHNLRIFGILDCLSYLCYARIPRHRPSRCCRLRHRQVARQACVYGVQGIAETLEIGRHHKLNVHIQGT